MEAVTQVFKTTDYNIFKDLEGNRIVNKLHVERLKKSFEEDYLVSPIIVNEKFQIIDGQHRFNAAKAIGKPVNFIVVEGYGLKQVQILNTNTKNWNTKDYLNAYCDLGYKDYLMVRKFANEYPDFSLSICLKLLAQTTVGAYRNVTIKSTSNKSNRVHTNSFNDGLFEVTDINTAHDYAQKLLMIKPYYDGFNRATFVSTMITLFKKENFEFGHFLNKLKLKHRHMDHCTNVEQYKILIEEIYNYKTRNKVNLRF